MKNLIHKAFAFLLSLSIIGFSFEAFAQPNDPCTGAIPISCGSSVSGSTAAATFDNVGFCGTSNTAPGIWYTIEGTGGPITLSTCNMASYDTKISVFTGSCASLTCVGGQDDAAGCAGFTTEFTFISSFGTTYFVLVHGFGSATGSFTLSAACLSDDCSSAIPIACNTTVSGSTVGAGSETLPFCGTSDGTGGGVWYRFSTSGSPTGNVTLSTCNPGSNYDTKIRVWEGSCGSLTCVAGNDDDPGCGFSSLRSTVIFTPNPNSDYFVLVHGFGSAEGNFELSFTANPSVCDDVLVPTLGEWGMILLVLLTFTFGALFVTRPKAQLAGSGGEVNLTSTLRNIPFHPVNYGKVLVLTLVMVIAGFALAILAFSYSMTNADIPGILFCTPVLAYLGFLFFGRE